MGEGGGEDRKPLETIIWGKVRGLWNFLISSFNPLITFSPAGTEYIFFPIPGFEIFVGSADCSLERPAVSLHRLILI